MSILAASGGRDTLPQSIPGPGSLTQSSELLDLGEDHETEPGVTSPPPLRQERADTPDQVLVADYRSASAMSIRSMSYNGGGGNLVSYTLSHCPTPLNVLLA